MIPWVNYSLSATGVRLVFQTATSCSYLVHLRGDALLAFSSLPINLQPFTYACLFKFSVLRSSRMFRHDIQKGDFLPLIITVPLVIFWQVCTNSAAYGTNFLYLTPAKNNPKQVHVPSPNHSFGKQGWFVILYVPSLPTWPTSSAKEVLVWKTDW